MGTKWSIALRYKMLVPRLTMPAGCPASISVNGCNDPRLLMTVRNEMRETVLSVPLLAACA